MAYSSYCDATKRDIFAHTSIFNSIFALAIHTPTNPLLNIGGSKAGYSVEKETANTVVTFRYQLDNDATLMNGGLYFEDRFEINPLNHKLKSFSRRFDGNITSSEWRKTLQEYRGDKSLNAQRTEVLDFYRNVVLRLPYQEANNSEAEVALHKAAVAQYPQNSQVHFALAQALQNNLEVEAALPSFQKAYQLEPHNAQIQKELGFSLYFNGHYLESLAFDPHNGSAYFQIGLDLYQQGKTEEALLHFHEALKYSPQDPDYLGQLSLALNQPELSM